MGKAAGFSFLLNAHSFSRVVAGIFLNRGRKISYTSENPSLLGKEGHYGLANMRERARKVDGQIRMQSEPGKGTRIELSVHAGEELSR